MLGFTTHLGFLRCYINIPKDHPSILEDEPKVGAQDCPGQPTNGWQLTPSGSVDAPLVVYQ